MTILGPQDDARPQTRRNRIAAAVRRARQRLSPAQRATRGQQRRYHIWSDASAILVRQGFYEESYHCTDHAVRGWDFVDPRTGTELEKD